MLSLESLKSGTITPALLLPGIHKMKKIIPYWYTFTEKYKIVKTVLAYAKADNALNDCTLRFTDAMFCCFFFRSTDAILYIYTRTYILLLPQS